MSGWPGKYVIGLTGNIATGKSAVRKMLEHLGANGIDADALSHQLIMKGSPGYQPVVETFGKWILAADGEIDRSRLGRIVFADSQALKQLEGIIHPQVSLAINILVSRTQRHVVVIEAIKLLESGLAMVCSAIWTVFSSREIQITRLIRKRGMSEAEAIQRVDSQSSQELKLKSAQVVIRNDGTYEEMWKQVYAAWRETFPAELKPQRSLEASKADLVVQRARPDESEQIAGLINRLSNGKRRLDYEQVMVAFGDKAYLLLRKGGIPCGILGWQVENLVMKIDDVYLDENLPAEYALSLLLKEAEDASQELNCELSLIFLPLKFEGREELFASLGYSSGPLQNLGVRAWEEAVRESLSDEAIVLYKKLREDRVLKPV